MRTDELIVQLARSAKAMRPLPPPAVRAAQWFAATLLVMVVATVMIGPRDDLRSALSQPIFLGSLAALLLTLASGGAAAFVLSVPGAERSAMQRAMPILTAAAWSGIWIAEFSAGAPAGGSIAVVHPACAAEIAICAGASGWLLLAMLARAAPLRPLWTATVAGLASMATGAVVAQVLCPLDDPTHQLVGHVVIALVVAGAGLLVGGRVIRSYAH